VKCSVETVKFDLVRFLEIRCLQVTGKRVFILFCCEAGVGGSNKGGWAVYLLFSLQKAGQFDRISARVC
jgi:hypothetical protein